MWYPLPIFRFLQISVHVRSVKLYNSRLQSQSAVAVKGKKVEYSINTMLIKNPNTKKQTSIPTIGRIYHSYIHNRPYHFSTLNTYYNKCHLIIHCHNVKSMGSFEAIGFQDVIGKLSQNDEVKISQRST